MRYRSYTGFSLKPIWVLIAINFLFFIATTINYELVLLLGFQPAGLSERPWTIITNLFIHGGLWHIFANMLTLFFFGSNVIRLVGQRSFFIIYFLGGILGNVFYMLLAPAFSIAIGASGAVFAMGGTLTMMRPKLPVLIFPIPAPIPLWIAVIGGFLIISFFPLVAWQAHLGGLVLGLVVGYFFRRRERRFF
ncbi:rhomboid family intramembrane serine protease [Chloroflexota bacterium]